MRRMLLLAVGVALGSCAADYYAIVLENRSSDAIDHAHVSFGDFVTVGGFLRPGSISGHGDISLPPPETAVVTWLDGGNKEHRVEVVVKSALQQEFFGPGESKEIHFSIQDDGTVKVWSEQAPSGTRKRQEAEWRQRQTEWDAKVRARCGEAKVYSMKVRGALSPNVHAARVSFGSLMLSVNERLNVTTWTDAEGAKHELGVNDVCEPVPETAVATWVDSSGTTHEVELAVRSAAPLSGFDEVGFWFQSDGTVKVFFEKYQE